jgi:hypothetical protein
MIRKIIACLACFCIVLSGCGEPVYYAPYAYGENGHCYYVYDAGEVVELQKAGLCHATWVAYPMPVYWHAMYYSYYSSPVYYNHYITARQRTYYKTVVITKFDREHRTEIRQYGSRGRWKGSDGKAYDGGKVTTTTKTTKTTTTTKTKTTKTTTKSNNSNTVTSKTTTTKSTTVRTTNRSRR